MYLFIRLHEHIHALAYMHLHICTCKDAHKCTHTKVPKACITAPRLAYMHLQRCAQVHTYEGTQSMYNCTKVSKGLHEHTTAWTYNCMNIRLHEHTTAWTYVCMCIMCACAHYVCMCALVRTYCAKVCMNIRLYAYVRTCAHLLRKGVHEHTSVCVCAHLCASIAQRCAWTYCAHIASRCAVIAQIAWTPFLGTGGSREPPVPDCVFWAAIAQIAWALFPGTSVAREPPVPGCVFEQL